MQNHRVSFDFATECEGGRCVVKMAGELDLAARTAFDELFEAAPGTAIEVDLSDVTFMDCGGYATIVDAFTSATAGRCAFRVTGARRQPRRLLALLSELGLAEPGLAVVGLAVSGPG